MRRFIFFLLLNSPFYALCAVQMKCISVGPSGEASIIWNNTTAAGTFRSYHVFHSVTASGPFALIDSVNIFANQSYLHLSANAIGLNAYYFIELGNLNGTTEKSDTIRAIRLNVIDLGDGYASLFWNLSHTPQITTNSIYQLIYREYPSGIFSLIDSVDASTSALNFLDEISICGDSVNYRVEVADASGCRSVSNIDGDFFIDRIAPDEPQIDSISVDASGNAVIGWSQSTSNDTYGYIIYQTDGSASVSIDTVYGMGNTFYSTLINATSGTQGFRIVGLDSCGNSGGADPLQQTIFLQGIVDRCSGSIDLNWNAYVNAPSLQQYQILMSENGGTQVVAGSTSSTNFTIGNLKTDSTYCFTITANLNGVNATTTSNTICVTPDLPVRPQFAYIRSVSVYPNEVVSVWVYVDSMADIKEYHLQRANSEAGNFITVQSEIFNGVSEVRFTDEVATNKIWYYRVSCIDSCGNDALTSEISKTIFLDSVMSDNFQNSFTWNSYMTWPTGISYYEIYRSVDGLYGSSPLAVVTVSDSSTTDDVSNLLSSGGSFCYFIVAYEAAGNPFGFSDSVRSNEICFRQKSGVFIPNAFHPGGINNIFNPSEFYVGLNGYSFEIFSRFGEVIFQTSRPETGWDGTVKGHLANTGVYVYRFKAKDEKGNDIEKVGRVTLIR